MLRRSLVTTSYDITAAQYAFAKRVQPSLPENLINEITTDKSFSDQERSRTYFQKEPDQVERLPHNLKLSLLGNSQLGLYISEYFFFRYPNLPTSSLKLVTSLYAGNQTVADFARGLGMTHLIRISEAQKMNPQSNKTLSTAGKALIGGIYATYGSTTTKSFIHRYFLSRQVDINSVLQIDRPIYYLTKLLQLRGMEIPVCRIHKETGRYSNEPVFVVGVYSGEKLLGEGHGPSIRLAEKKAAEHALQRYYLHAVPVETLPSDDIYTPPPSNRVLCFGEDELNL